MKVYVHRNLNRRCWSVLLRGKLHSYRQNITLRDVEFRIRPGGYARYLREARRNVHAFMIGDPTRGIPEGKGILIRYDLNYGQFVNPRGEAYSGAEAVRMDGQGRVWAYGLIK